MQDFNCKQPSDILPLAPADLCCYPSLSRVPNSKGFSGFYLGQVTLGPTECPIPSQGRRGTGHLTVCLLIHLFIYLFIVIHLSIYAECFF